MPQLLSRQVLSLSAALVFAAGSTLALPALADDGGTVDMPSKPAAPKAAPPAAEKPADAKAAATTSADTKPAEKGPKDSDLLADFVHYVLIDRIDAARSMGEGLVARNLSDVDFAKLVDSTMGPRRFNDAVIRAQRRPDLEPIASRLLKAYDNGKLAAARSPETITGAIKQLTGTMRQRLYAHERLIEAGEYAMPQLLSTLLQPPDPTVGAEVRQVMVEMGKQSVIPLSIALPNLSPENQEIVAGILGDMPQTQSLPFLYDLAKTTTSDTVRSAAESAVRKIGGAFNPQMSVADRFTDLADAFLKASPSLISFQGEPEQLYWNYKPEIGLVMTAVDSRVFPQAMAMRLTEMALARDAASGRAVSTWIAANFLREINTPEGYVNPVYGPDRREAMYYAVAAGAGPSERVLARALDSSDTPLARKALAAIEQTSGAKTLFTGSADRRPLLEALKYPNRRVQYEAALALGASQPREAFPGSDQVVRTLASSIRDAGARFVLVLSSDTETQSSLLDLFRQQGYTPLPPATTLDQVRQAIADAPGVDLIVTDLPSESTAAAIAQTKGDARLRATPILALLSAQGYSEQAAKFARDPMVSIARSGLGPKDITQAASGLVDTASGGVISADEAQAYRQRALSVLRDLAVGNNPVLNVADAQAPLVGALEASKGETKIQIIEVLSFINSPKAQSTIMDAAMNAEGDEKVRLLGLVAASAKRFGNQLEPRQVEALVSLAGTAKGPEATAAAALMGALNLPGDHIVPLILGTR